MIIKEAMFEHAPHESDILVNEFTSNFSINKTTDEIRILYIKKALMESHNSITKAAKLLGLTNYQTLSGWIEKYNINLDK